MLHNNLIGLLAGAASLFGGPFTPRIGDSNVYLRVGPGINATISMTGVHLSCSDDASCQFKLPANSIFDVVARGGSGHPFRWTGCKAQPEANQCRVDLRNDAILITVR